MSRKREKNKKVEKMEIIISSSIALFIILLVVVLVVISKHVADKKQSSSSAESTSSGDNVKYGESAEKYSAGLTEDGKIAGIENIENYVKLPDKLDEYILYLKDYPMEDEAGIASAGSYLIDRITEDSEIRDYEEYRKVIEEILRYNAEGWYSEYAEAHKNVDESEKYTSFEDFMKYSQNMDMDTYEKHIVTTSVKEMRKYLTEQALVEKLGIEFTDADIETTAKVSTGSNNTGKTYERFGMPYMKQRTAEYKLESYLVEKAEKKEGSIKDGWEDKSLVYGAGLYDNGRISGIGDISSYINAADETKYDLESGSFDGLVAYMLDNSEIKPYEDYIENLKALYAYEEGGKASDYEKDAEDEYCYRLVIQYLYDKFSLSSEYARILYFDNMSVDEKNEFLYTYGNAYTNRQMIEQAVWNYCSEKSANKNV